MTSMGPVGDTVDTTAGIATGSGTADATTGSATSSTGAMTETTDDPPASSSGSSTTGEGSSGPPMTDSGPLFDLGNAPAPDGTACDFDNECASGNCYVAGVLGGICGECNSDADCPGGGCSVPNPVAGIGSVCNLGDLGDGCETDAVCQPDLTCETIIAVPGVITVATCSECQLDSDCAPGTLCSPTYDVVGFAGVRSCVTPGTVVLGEGCDLQPSGADECETGLCAPASLMGLLTLGICSECITDDDCSMATCSDASIDLAAGLLPAVCI